MNKIPYHINLFLVILLLCVGCVKENTEDCFSGLRLRFDFSLHTQQAGNRFGPDVRVIRVYCFDQQGVLRHIQEESGEILTNDYVMDVELKAGKYKVIAWGGGQNELCRTYHEGAKIDANTPCSTLKIDETTLDQFWFIMNSTEAPNLPENVVPQTNELDDLYYGALGVRHSQTSVYALEEVEVLTGHYTERQIELIRNTNILKVTVSGIHHLSSMNPGDFRIWTVIRNGEYRFDNSIVTQTPTIRYTPYYSATDATSVVADIKVLRLDMERHKAEPILLYIETPDGRKLPNKPIDVVNTLLEARNPKTQEYIYKYQSDFDKIYEHPIELRIGPNLEITIFIDEWEIVHVKPA